EDGIRDFHVTGVQTCALPILAAMPPAENTMHYFAAAAIFALLLFYFIYSITRQPFTFLYGKVQGIPLLRRQHGLMWLSVYAVARSEERRVGEEWRGAWREGP